MQPSPLALLLFPPHCRRVKVEAGGREAVRRIPTVAARSN